MNIQELKDLINEKVESFKDYLSEEDYPEDDPKNFKSLTGLEFCLLESFRDAGDGDFNGYTWRFQIGDRIYQHHGYYDSWAGTEIGDPMDFYEVKPVEKTVIEYERV